jgi:hypothetical protein
LRAGQGGARAPKAFLIRPVRLVVAMSHSLFDLTTPSGLSRRYGMSVLVGGVLRGAHVARVYFFSGSAAVTLFTQLAPLMACSPALPNRICYIARAALNQA